MAEAFNSWNNQGSGLLFNVAKERERERCVWKALLGKPTARVQWICPKGGEDEIKLTLGS